MSKLSLAETLAVIAEKAPALREAGVLKIDIDDVYLELAPPDPPETTGVTDNEDDFDDRDPLDDPATFGRKKTVPRRRDPDDDE